MHINQRRSRPCKATAQLIRSSRGEVSCSPQHSTLGGAGDRTNNLPVTSQPALPPELSLGRHKKTCLSPGCHHSASTARWEQKIVVAQRREVGRNGGTRGTHNCGRHFLLVTRQHPNNQNPPLQNSLIRGKPTFSAS